MAIGSLDLTIVSASISPNVKFEFEPVDTYATARCIKEQRTTKTARDQGRLPAWNETFTFNMEDEDIYKDILVHVFSLGSEQDEVLGVARIPIATAIRMPEGTLCSLYSPSKGETGKLRTAWKWRPMAQGNTKGMGPERTCADGDNTFNDVTDALAKLSVDKVYSGKSMPSAPPFEDAYLKSRGEMEAYSSQASRSPLNSDDVTSFGSYPPGVSHSSYDHSNPNSKESQVYARYPDVSLMGPGEMKVPVQESGTYISSVYPSFKEYSECKPSTPPSAMPGYPQSTAAYSSYPAPASSLNYSQISPDKQIETSAYTTRGIGETKEKGKGHNPDVPFAYPPRYPSAPYPAGYPPAPYLAPGYRSAYPPPYGYPPGGYQPAPVYPPAPGYPPAPAAYTPAPAYPPAPGYPPAQHGYPPVPHGYPPASGHHSAPAYPSYGHNLGYAGGAYVDHSSNAKHSHHHKNPKHSKHEDHHLSPQYLVHGHHHKGKKEKKHKKHKHKFFGKGLKFKF